MSSRIKKSIIEKNTSSPSPLQSEERAEAPQASVRKRVSPLKAINWGRFSALVIVVIVALSLLVSFISSLFSWKAVFLDSGQVYFGKSFSLPFSSSVRLTHVYYVRDASEGGSTDVIVAKITDDVHKPTDKLVINKEHILYTQVLASDSPLVQKMKDAQ